MDLIYVLYALLGVGFLIFIHELGHFLAAKKVGVRVETFCIGFQPTIFGFRARFFAFRRGETEYALGMIPFGGYVKMAGEELRDERTGADDEFPSKTVGERALVLVAGALMNLFGGLLLFVLAFTVGINSQVPAVGVAQREGPAWEAGVRAGDRIVAINGKERGDFTEIMTSVALAGLDRPLKLTLDRGGEANPTRLEFDVQPEKDTSFGMPTIGIAFSLSWAVGEVEDDSPAARAGVRKGDRIVGITVEDAAGRMLRLPDTLTRTQQWYLLRRYILEHFDCTWHLEIDRNGAVDVLAVKAEQRENPDQAPHRLGIGSISRRIKRIQPGSDASEIFAKGTEITTLNGQPVYSLQDNPWVVLRIAPDPTILTFTTGDGATGEVDRDKFITWISSEIVFEPGEEAIVGFVQAGSPGDQAGFRLGDRIVRHNGTEIEGFTDFLNRMTEESRLAEPREQTIVVRRGAEELTLSATPAPLPAGGRAGFSLTAEQFRLRTGPWEACTLGTERAIMWAGRIFLTLKALAKREVAPSNLAGPIGIVDVGRRVVRHGFGKFLYILALISINLGVLNLLPIPILDGGHLLFLAIEKIKGSPVSERIQGWAFTVAFVLLIGLALFVTYHDIRRIF